MNRTIQWLNANHYRRYPFIDDSLPVVGGTSIPDDLLLDFQLADYTVTPTDGSPLIRLAKITFTTGVVREAELTFQYGGPTTEFSVTVPLNAALPYTATLQTSLVFMQVVVGPGLATISAALPADAAYTATASTLQPALVMLQNRHRVLSLLGDADGSVAVSGDVYWEEGYNTRIELDVAAGQLRLNAVPGAGAGFPCDVNDVAALVCDDVLIALNDIYGDVAGGMELIGAHGIEIEPDPANNRIIVRTRVQDLDIECE